MEPLVSIIVPVYNVEKYVERCIGSLTNQTYSNLEIIVVDDGTPDKSGEIVDRLAKADSRIRVFHKQNGGLSSARNYALDRAKGEYITFVDSDDYIELDLVESCLKLCEKEGNDVVIYRLESMFADHTELQRIDPKDYVDTESILNGILWDDVPSYAVKFYRMSLWEKVRFPLHTNWEDLATMPDIFSQVKKVAYIDRPLYHYECANVLSISSGIKSKNKFGMYLGWRKRKEIAEQRNYEKLREHACMRSIRSAVTGLGLNTVDNLLLPEQVNELESYIKDEYCNGRVPNIGTKYKILVWGLLNCPSILSFYGNIMYLLEKFKH